MWVRVAVALVWGNVTIVVPVQWQETLESRVLDGTNTRSRIRPGHESSEGSAQLIRRWGLLMDLSLGQRTGEEKS